MLSPLQPMTMLRSPKPSRTWYQYLTRTLRVQGMRLIDTVMAVGSQTLALKNPFPALFVYAENSIDGFIYKLKRHNKRSKPKHSKQQTEITKHQIAKAQDAYLDFLKQQQIDQRKRQLARIQKQRNIHRKHPIKR